MKHKINLNACYSIVFEALAANKGMQYITDALFKYTKMPINVVDMSFKVLAASYITTTGCKHVDDIIQLGYVLPEVVMQDYYDLGYIENAESHEKSSIVNWGLVETPLAVGAIRINGNVEGICSTTITNEILEPIALEINDILCKALAIEMERSQLAMSGDADPKKQIIAREIFENVLSGSDKKKNTHLEGLSSLKSPFQILVITPVTRNNTRVQYIRNVINEDFRDVFCFMKDGYLYIMVENLRELNREQKIIQSILERVKQHKCLCGISGLFYDLSERFDFLLRAQKALEIGQVIHPEKNIYKYDEYYLEIVASYAALGLGKTGYKLTELDNLRNVDDKKGTDYYYTLKNYLVLGNNISKTASKMNIHRNTLIYRLSKIEEITGVDINNQSVIRRLLTAMIMYYVHESILETEDSSFSKEKDFWMGS